MTHALIHCGVRQQVRSGHNVDDNNALLRGVLRAQLFSKPSSITNRGLYPLNDTATHLKCFCWQIWPPCPRKNDQEEQKAAFANVTICTMGLKTNVGWFRRKHEAEQTREARN